METASRADLWLGLVLLGLLAPITASDLARRVIPNRITYPGSLAAGVICAALAPAALAEHVLAGAGAGAFLLVPALLCPRGMGLGDVKLAAMLGLFLGRAVAVALLVALAAGAAAGAFIVARVGVRAGRAVTLPFGPFLAGGGVVALLAGPGLVDRWLGTVG